MENLPKEKQPIASKLKFFLFLGLGLVILVLIGEGIYWLKLNKAKKLFTGETSEQTETEVFLSEEQLSAAIIRLFPGEKSEGAQDILKCLEEIKKRDPQKYPENSDQDTYYTTIASILIGEYYASGDSPEKRNPEILKVLAQIREMARQNPYFDEELWKVEGVDSY